METNEHEKELSAWKLHTRPWCVVTRGGECVLLLVTLTRHYHHQAQPSPAQHGGGAPLHAAHRHQSPDMATRASLNARTITAQLEFDILKGLHHNPLKHAMGMITRIITADLDNIDIRSWRRASQLEMCRSDVILFDYIHITPPKQTHQTCYLFI